MQYTSNYNLLLPEGTDTVNLLTQMNPNTSDIDAAMYANKQMGVGRATESTAGTVHAITRANQDSPIFAFTATSNWTQGDTMSVDGVTCSVYLTDGSQPATGSYVINSEVVAIVQGSRVTLLTSSGAIIASNVSFDNTGTDMAATNVESAIKELNAQVGSGQIVATADGIKTYGDLLTEISAQINVANYSDRCYMKTGVEVFQLSARPTGRLRFSECRSGGSGSYILSVTIGTQTAFEYVWIKTDGTVQHFNSTSDVPTAGYQIVLHA